MTTQIDLKQIERKAYRSVYQDGLWDIFYGLIIISMAIFMFRPEEGYNPANILLGLFAFIISYSLLWAGKRYITLPRMGQVTFGEMRKKRRRTLAILLSGVIIIQVGFVASQMLAWLDPEVGNSLNTILKDKNIMDLVVASIGALFIGPSMLLVAYYRDFLRGYYIAILMMLAVFLMIYQNQPIYPIIIGCLIILPGVILFIRFLQKYPHPQLEPGDK